jgi:Phage integrase, N-terminal SAM-like domain
VERNIYRRSSGVYEIGVKDASGKQRWRTVDGDNTALRDELLTQRYRGGRIASDTRVRLADAA